jgi:hypothetical protein
VNPAAPAWAAEAGVTYRQLDYWTRRGWIRADGHGKGSGRPRCWPALERSTATLMARLVGVGFHPAAAAPIARARARAQDPIGIDLGAGVSVHLE